MGPCCSNEARDKRLDNKEECLAELRAEEQVIEKATKQKTETLSPGEEDAMFEEGLKKIKSHNAQVNVFLLLLQGYAQGERVL